MDDITQRKVIAGKIERGEPIILAFKYINEKVLMTLNSILVKILAQNDQIFLLNSAVTILREIIVNALKANSKRVFFIKNELNINDEEQYKKGMHKFKKQIIGDFNKIEADLLRSDFFVRITFKFDPSMIHIAVGNDAPILPIELERIQYRIDKALQYNDFSEAYEEIEDDTEGAGLGIVLIILLLKNMGIDPRNYVIEGDVKSTQVLLKIPAQLKPEGITTKIKARIIKDIDGIPTFPENLLQLERLCNDPEAPIDRIVRMIKVDPALSADVIKLSNSAGIAPYKRIEDIKSAVVTIGMKNLNAIIVASNARRILNERYSSFEMIWEHCNKVAFYARNIALTYRFTAIVENVYMAGLLHDLGKIVLLATDKKLVRKIANIVNNRNITTSTMEEISIGISHSAIGSLIAQKWNFPDYLVEAIQFHHSPYSSPDKFKDTIHTIYLANMLVGIEERKYAYFYIDESILERFDLIDPSAFSDFHEKIKAKYKQTIHV